MYVGKYAIVPMGNLFDHFEKQLFVASKVKHHCIMQLRKAICIWSMSA